MRKKLLAILIVFSFISVASFSVMFFVKGETTNPLEEILSARSDGDLEGIDGTQRFAGYVLEGAQPDTGNPWVIPVSDDYYEMSYMQTFECVVQGVYGNIWIGLNNSPSSGLDPAYPDEYVDNGIPGFSDDDMWYFGYPWSSIGADADAWGAPDPDNDGYYMPPGYRDWISGANLTYMMDQFDNNIHDTVVNHFGMYADRPGPFGDYKIQILIFNIRDGLFWDPVTAPWFIAGYFSSYVSNLNDANIFHMDTYQWWRRTGERADPLEYGLWPLPLQYEGTFAHEFQHLVHRDVDYNELAWVNEGCSTLAEWLCGYGFSPGHISEYLIWFWDTSLVMWQGELSSYGAVFLFTFYMYEHYGGASLIWDLVHEQANGIEGWNNVLNNRGIWWKDFDSIFEDWAIANYLDDTSFAGGKYGYYALDIPSADTDWYSIPEMVYLWNSWYSWFDIYVDEYPNHGYNYPYGSQLPYTVSYIEFHDAPFFTEIEFDGDDFCGVPAYSGNYEWYSDGTAYSWFRLGQEFSIPVTGATLNFMSYYEIESNWDYGYVEVYDITDDEWYTLPGLTTVSTLPQPQDNPNCPDGFDPQDYFAAGRWNAFTGFSPGWYQETMDLTPFAGHDIELYFTYWTDPFYLELGWYIDDIEIPEIGFTDDCEAGEDGWVADPAGWYLTTGTVDNDFEVNFIRTQTVDPGFYPYNSGTEHRIYRMSLDDNTETGDISMMVINSYYIHMTVIMVVANQPGYEHGFTTYFEFTADGWTWPWW
jgi:hypothetical protein